MTLNVVYRRAARFEFDVAADWYDRQRPELGKEFISEIEKAVALAASAPAQFQIVIADVRRIRSRRFPFSVYYRVRGQNLIVLAVFHGRRNPHIWQQRI